MIWTYSMLISHFFGLYQGLARVLALADDPPTGPSEAHFPILEAILSIKPANAQFTGWVGRKKPRSLLNKGFHTTKTRSGHGPHHLNAP